MRGWGGRSYCPSLARGCFLQFTITKSQSQIAHGNSTPLQGNDGKVASAMANLCRKAALVLAVLLHVLSRLLPEVDKGTATLHQVLSSAHLANTPCPVLTTTEHTPTLTTPKRRVF